MNWLRWHHGTVSDPKWRVIARLTGVPLSAIPAIWATILESASNNEECRGSLSGWNSEEIAAALDLDTAQVQAVFDSMQGRTLSGNQLIAWEKRNPKRERDDDSTERVRKWRDRDSNDMKRNVTPRNATKHPEERRVEKKEGEGEQVRASFGEFGHVLLTSDQHAKLLVKLDGNLDAYINRLDRWGAESPDKFRKKKSHYATILNWFDRDVKEGNIKPEEPKPATGRLPFKCVL